jgi:membrane protein YdbS with pleckstrin-like domain
MVTLREAYPLENIKPLKKTISSSWIFTLIIVWLSSPVLVRLFIFPEVVSYWIMTFYIGIIFIFVIVKYVYEVFYMKSYFYDLVDDYLIIRKGVFSKNEITLPVNRIQDVYVDQDIFDRIFGLYDVHVSSATIISAHLSHIDGVNKENAQALKNLIISKIHSKGA